MDQAADVVVIGGGPSGALAARELARRGVSVVLLERESFPRWKVCGACVGPAALASLRAVGLGEIPLAGNAVPLRQSMAIGPSGSSALLPLKGGVAWSRAAMDALLLAEAEAAGVSVRLGVRAELGPVDGAARVVRARARGAPTESAIRARLVLDASGLGGAPHRGAGRSADTVAPDARVGVGTVLTECRIRRPGMGRVDLTPGRIVMVVGRTGYVGMVRLEDGTVDVAAAVDADSLRGAAPEEVVEGVLAEAGCHVHGTPVRPWRGTPPLTRAPRSAAMERCLRVGDALGYVEPFTGEGIGWALASARAVQPVALRGLTRWDDGVEGTWEAFGPEAPLGRSGSAGPFLGACVDRVW